MSRRPKYLGEKHDKYARVEIRFFISADLYEQMRKCVSRYDGSVADFVRRSCFNEIQRQKSDPQQ